MTAVVVLVCVVVWFGFGAVGAIACGRCFVREFGRGEEPLGLMVFVLIVGPIGALASLMMSAYRWQDRQSERTGGKHTGRLSRFLDRTAL